MSAVPQLVPFQFKPGQSGNPAGRAKGARDKLQSDFLSALAEDFGKYGADAIQRARTRNPNQYINAIARLMPRQIDLTDASNMADEDVLAMVKEALANRLARSDSTGGTDVS